MGFFSNIFWKKESNIEENIQSEENTLNIARDANIFIEWNSDIKDKLDYSIESLSVVDDILWGFYEHFKWNVPEWLLLEVWRNAGSYIFETLRRNFGWKYYWYDDLNQPILVTWEPDFWASILAIEKVKLRIVNWSEDNIPFFVEWFIQAVKNKESKMYI